MHAFIDKNTIICSDGGKTIMVAAQDPAFGQAREYLMDDTIEHDFDVVRSIVYMSRHLVDTFGQSDSGSVPWNR
jgi:hypothetical protein